MTMDFGERYGPWALVTGGSEGTGAAFARALAARGLNCILVARREAPLAALAAGIRAESGVECVTAAIDLGAADAIERIVAAVGTRDVGLYIANAGADTRGSGFLDVGIEHWIGLVNLNVLNTMRCCHHFGGAMRARGRGGIILVGSGACYGGMSGLAVYAGSKAFDLCFGEALWSELRPHGVDVLNLVLGRTDTPALRALLAARGLPVPPGLASPEEVAAVGLERLPHGPVHNWGLAEDQAGYAPQSAAARRARIVAMEQAAKAVLGGA